MRDTVQPGVSGPALLLTTDKISASHRSRDAYVYVRQSTPTQMVQHTESLARQYELRERAVALGWPAHQVVVIDADLGRSGAQTDGRHGFKELVADVGLGKVGIVLGIEVSRLARNNADWYQLLDLCAITDTLIADADGVYHPAEFNDRLVLGLKGTMSEASNAKALMRTTPLCRSVRVGSWWRALSALGVRHNHSPSRKARTASGGW